MADEASNWQGSVDFEIFAYVVLIVGDDDLGE